MMAASGGGGGGRITPDRLGCLDGIVQEQQPVNRVNTTLRLQQLRVAMSATKLVRGAPLKAYIITSDDEHQVNQNDLQYPFN
jgi:hypothetical protein